MWEMAPIEVQLNSSPAIGTFYFGLVAPLWEMGLRPRSHLLDGESTCGQALPGDGEDFESQSQSAVDM